MRAPDRPADGRPPSLPGRSSVLLAVALGAQHVDGGEGGEGVRDAAAASRRRRPPSGRRRFQSTSMGGFASFGQWLHTKEGDTASVSTDG